MKTDTNFQPIQVTGTNDLENLLQRLVGPHVANTRGVLFEDLILCRGLPGSGKSAVARALAKVGYAHFEADMFFYVDGIYRYDGRSIQDAHDWCKRKTREALRRGDKVVVSNTFTRLSEMAPYYAMGANAVRVIEATGRWENRHGVSKEQVQRMSARWEPLPAAMRASQASASLTHSAMEVQ